MNYIIALILAIIILLCMFLIRNKLLATGIILVLMIMLILTRPSDFSMGHAYIAKHTVDTNNGDGTEYTNNPNTSANNSTNTSTNNSTNNSTNIPTASNDSYNSLELDNVLDSYSQYKNNISNMLGLSENNTNELVDTIQDIDWSSVFERAVSDLKSYGNEDGANNGVSGNDNTTTFAPANTTTDT